MLGEDRSNPQKPWTGPEWEEALSLFLEYFGRACTRELAHLGRSFGWASEPLIGNIVSQWSGIRKDLRLKIAMYVERYRCVKNFASLHRRAEELRSHSAVTRISLD